MADDGKNDPTNASLRGNHPHVTWRYLRAGDIDGFDPCLKPLAGIYKEYSILYTALKPSPVTTVLFSCVVRCHESRFLCLSGGDQWIAAKELFGLDQEILCIVVKLDERDETTESLLRQHAQHETILALSRLRKRKTGQALYEIYQGLDDYGRNLLTSGRWSVRAFLARVGANYRAVFGHAPKTEGSDLGKKVEIKESVTSRDERELDDK